MKVLKFFLILAITCINLSAQTVFSDFQGKHSEALLLNGDISTSTIQFNLGEFELKKVQTPKGNAYVIDGDNLPKIISKGNPELCKMTTSIIIPNKAEMEYKLVDSKFKDYKNIEIAPSKGPFYISQDYKSIPYFYGKTYKQNKFYPSVMAKLGSPHIFKNVRGQNIELYPFRYNPVTKTLRVYSTVTIKVSVKSKNSKINNLQSETASISKSFKSVYDLFYLNSKKVLNNSKLYEFAKEKMLIICYDSFVNAMTPYVEWKRQRGVDVEIVNTTTTGTSSANIKSYITDYYNNHNDLTYVVFVGDEDQVSPMTTNYIEGYPSQQDPGPYAFDTEYFLLSGNDNYPEVIGGRISAESVTDVTTQITKFISYEKNPPVTNRLNQAGLLSLKSGPDGSAVWEYMRTVNNELENFTYANCKELYEENLGDDLPYASNISSMINDGISYLSWISHGNTDQLSSFYYSNSNLNSLTNTTWPMIWCCSCMTGKFNKGITCFAETWMRAKNGSTPAGAVSVSMSTVMMYGGGIGEAMPIQASKYLTGHYGDLYRTYGNITTATYAKMIEQYPQNGQPDLKFHILFGDPSLQVRTDIPKSLTINAPNAEPGQDYQLTVKNSSNSAVKNALVSLYQNNKCYSAFTNNSGVVSISHSLVEGNAKLTVTAFNYETYFEDITVGPSGPAPTITVNPASITIEMPANSTNSRSITIKNTGEAESTLNYNITKAYTAKSNLRNPDNIEGSTFTSSTDSYTSGDTFDIIFTVKNESIDTEWLEGATLDFPTGVTVNSATNLAGGSAGDLVSDNSTGNGAKITWSDENGGYGNIKEGETATTTINITVDGSFSGDMDLTWTLAGDIYGGEPHNISGTITLTSNVTYNWLSITPVSGSCDYNETNTISVNFDTAGLDGGIFNANITISSNGGNNIIIPVTLKIGAGINDNTPKATTLYQNYPNPFNPVTAIKFYTSINGNVNLTVFNVTGEIVKSLVSKNLSKGYHSINFNAKSLNSGVYYYKLQTENTSIIKKMILVK